MLGIVLQLPMLYWEGLLQSDITILGNIIIWRYNNGNFHYNLAIRYRENLL